MATTARNAPRPGTYDVGRPASACGKCGRPLPPGDRLTAALTESPAGFDRHDFCPDCWAGAEKFDWIAFWQTTVPRPGAKKKLFVDDAALCEVFVRLADTADPAKLQFRFVLGLILMRKRLLTYQSSQGDLWQVKLRGRDESLAMTDPKLTEQQVGDVSRQLGEILSEGA